ncbi:MAG: vitamin K epoxide reductase family protein [Acidobacteriota bacterium]
MKILKVVALVLSLIGITDSTYLTIHHYTAEPVPCSIVEGCETVLTSGYAEVAGIPLAAYGAAAYLVAFMLVLISLFGNRLTWKLFGLQTVFMALFSAWLIYVQAKLIGAFCQFCLLSAATTFSLFIVFIISLLISGRETRTDLS